MTNSGTLKVMGRPNTNFLREYTDAKCGPLRAYPNNSMPGSHARHAAWEPPLLGYSDRFLIRTSVFKSGSSLAAHHTRQTNPLR
jgi:hypothetical protein